ncbi:MAG: response regulator [Symploca sp. SIO2C1]|nr:response regulator [Symploca sp. SIO2C1]
MTNDKGNILIVDDSLESLQLLSNNLSEQGYQIRGVAKGKLAIRTAQLSPPDLILLDIKMPEMNGYEVCEHLKSDEQTCDIPVIFISALDEVIDKVKAFQLGAVDYITKPFQVEEVLARIEHQLTIQRLQRQLQLQQLQLQQQNQQLQQEIQERKNAEEQAAAASKAKSQFLANMSHELRTPLNAILGFTQVMRRDSALNIEQQEYLNIIHRSGEHLLELINDVLDLSKIEAGLIVLNEKSFDFYRLLDNLEQMFQFKAEQKQLELVFCVSPDVPQYIKTDEQKLRGCLINLLVNAIKFTNRGQVTLTVTIDRGATQNKSTIFLNLSDMESEDKSESYLLFSVSDTGPGIAPEEMDNLFDAFVQTSLGMKFAEGTGLGLSITQKFVHLMGGEITVSSVVGEGTTFQFNIKINAADSLEIITTTPQQVIGLVPEQEIYRILVVDDTEENRILLVKLLKPIGFEVREANNGAEGIAIWESWQPHLIFMDTRMPVMDGLKATKQIRDKVNQEMGRSGDTETILNYQTIITKIIALTASAFEDRRGEILAAGSDDFVRKPFTEEIIFEKISEHLKVSYLYQDLTPPLRNNSQRKQATAQLPDSFWREQLEAMSPAWLTRLDQAATQVNEDLIIELIEEIPDTQSSLAEALRDLVDDFRLDIILYLTQLISDK